MLTFNLRLKFLKIMMLLTFEIIERARNRGKKVGRLSQTPFSGIVHCTFTEMAAFHFHLSLTYTTMSSHLGKKN